MSEGRERLFVYGTLRSGFSNHHRIERDDVEFLGKASIQGLLYDLGSYPGVVPSRSRARVFGELYSLADSSFLADLDAFEGYDPTSPEKSLYVRKEVDVWRADETLVRAWVYFLGRRPRNASRIPGGDYARVRLDS